MLVDRSPFYPPDESRADALTAAARSLVSSRGRSSRSQRSPRREHERECPPLKQGTPRLFDTELPAPRRLSTYPTPQATPAASLPPSWRAAVLARQDAERGSFEQQWRRRARGWP